VSTALVPLGSDREQANNTQTSANRFTAAILDQRPFSLARGLHA
jgi:hypothetical protein